MVCLVRMEIGLDVHSLKASLTVRLTGRAERKLGESDLVPPRGWGITQRIKVTLGITG